MKNLDTFFSSYRPIIESYLTATLAPFVFDDPRKDLQEAVRYSLTAKAKRIRPLLVIAIFLLYRSEHDIDQILPLAAAIEMIHTYSLIHDDLPAMDNDDFRRGMPTCHKKFGEDTAILAGDTLNTYAWELLAQELPNYFNPDLVLKCIQLLAQHTGLTGMIGGQMMDIYAKPANFNQTYLTTMHNLKTGALLTASVTLPSVLLAIPESDFCHLRAYGHAIGLLFQVTDDILDVISSTEVLGKTVGKDQAQQKLTYTSLLGVEGAQQMAQELADSAKAHLESLSDTNQNQRIILEELITYILKRTF